MGRRSKARRGVRIVGWSILAGVLLVPVVGAELYLRSIGLGTPILYGVNDSYRYAPVPLQKTVRRGGATVTIDQYGLRTTQDWTMPDAARILFLGDSVTWGGTNVSDTQTFAHRVCVHLNDSPNGEKGLRTVCGNAGVNAYGVTNMALRLRHAQIPAPDCVVAVILPGDALRGTSDVTQHYFYTRKPPQPFPALWEATGFVISRLAQFMTKGDAVLPEPPAVTQRVAEEALDGLYAQLRHTQAAGKSVFLVYTPYEKEVTDGKAGATGQIVRDSMAASGIPVIDVTPALTAAHRASPGTALYTDGVHYTADGHHAVAIAIADGMAGRCPGPL